GDRFAVFIAHMFSFPARRYEQPLHVRGVSLMLQVYLFARRCTMKPTHSLPTVCALHGAV
ncbi:MAG TPA: hypothetical protein VGJ87_06645, partial [Roseiflexaceae bacterium]